MRFERLDLIRFGRFTDRVLEMPAGARDLHIVAGPNEAGKTTAMVAIEDLLFGIAPRTPYGFRHPFETMRLGAVIAQDGKRLSFRRRKGNRDTLLGPDDRPLPDSGALAPFLGGADRVFFERMFNLGYERLAKGGREILAAGDDVGQALFAAGSGLQTLREHRKRLDGEAVSLWAPRRAKQRRYYEAEARLKETDGMLRSAIRRPKEWRDLRRALDEAEARLEELNADHQRQTVEARRLARIRRVIADVRQKAVLDAEIAVLGRVVLLPEGAKAALEAATRETDVAEAAIRILEGDRRGKRAERAALAFDESTYRHRETIRELAERAIKVRQMRFDLPKRQGELEAALEDLRRHGREIDWEPLDAEALLARIPSRAAVARLRDLLQRRGGLDEARKAAESAVAAARRRLVGQQERVGAAGARDDPSKLRAVLAAIRDDTNLDAELRQYRGELSDIDECIRELRAKLHPPMPRQYVTPNGAATLRAPSRHYVEEHRDLLRARGNDIEEIKKRRQNVQLRLESSRQERARTVREERIETPEALGKSRTARDGLWNAVKSCLLGEDRPEGSPAELARRFETTVRHADEIADRRFDQAEAAGRLAEMDRAIRNCEAEIEETVTAEAEVRKGLARLEDEWKQEWEGCPFEPEVPVLMLEWLDQSDALAEAENRRRRAEERLSLRLADQKRAHEQLIESLAATGFATEDMRTDSLRVLVRRAEEIENEQREGWRRSEDARAAVKAAMAELADEEAQATDARTAWTRFEEDWTAALVETGLHTAASPETVTSQLALLENMREAAATAENLTTRRIGAMKRDISVFEQAVSELVAVVAPEWVGVSADDAMHKLDERLRQELARRQSAEELAAEIARITGDIEERRRALVESQATLAPLRAAVGTEDLASLTEAAEKSDRQRALRLEREQVLPRLRQEGDGLPFEQLELDCKGMDPDQARGLEEAAEAARKTLQDDLQQAHQSALEARSALSAFGADDAAARLAAGRQEALAGMRDAAERYARVRTAAILLSWALERFRHEKQDPMLRRASALFRTLTGGSFIELRVGFDEKDRMRLDAVREDGKAIVVSGLSAGTEDQLYLALRVAAVEDYVSRAVPLPFVADDLFVNFDEERSAAGFRILGELAGQTQVIFFTHHEHLVDIARDVLGADFPVTRLGDR